MDTERFRIRPGTKVRLDDHDPAFHGKYDSKDTAADRLAEGIQEMRELQERLYAQDRYSVLLIFQALDAAGKDSTIEHVMSGVNPQGCEVHSFKAPSEEELDHDFLWRSNRRLPERGRIGVFNRSYYEEVLVVRVHPEILARQKVPAHLVTERIWRERFEDIVNLERYLSRNGTVIRKFFLNVSKAEQKKRFLSRLDDPEKHWKFSPDDVKERERWKDYRTAYEEALAATSTEEAPWYVIPADHKWFTRMAVADVIVDTLRGMKLEFPRVPEARRPDYEAARARLLAEK